ncbi:MAG: putative toxin-antitoxin system toxin component, PIN family [Patescibacteria group bacterium]|nr:putative toxin-antitoxin system toxin component, PIN family [Patescibacteria group bacterium]
MYKVVLDTNLLINGSGDDYNYGSRIIDAVNAGKLLAFANRATLRENQLIAESKVKDETYRKKLQEFFGKVHRVESFAQKLDVVADSEDNKLVESAAAARADFLISSDRHLLDLEEFEGIKIVAPEAFWSEYMEASGAAWKDWLKNFIR